MSQPPELSPRIGTVLKGDGRVCARDVTRFGMHRMTVERMESYPDLGKWLAMLPAGANVQMHYYEEGETEIAGTKYLLKLFWKE